jgi:nitrite reductase/ring-hydroxylating ferredoxin subunit
MSNDLPATDVPIGTVTGVAGYAVGNNGDYFALGRRCRHLRADLAEGTINEAGCLVCPWHHAEYDVGSGVMLRGPQGAFAKVPGLEASIKAFTKVMPLKRGTVEVDGDQLHIT